MAAPGHHFPLISQVKPLFSNDLCNQLVVGGHRMSHQNARYLKLKGKTFYFSRRVPKPLQSVTSVNRIEVCLHTRSRPYAERQALLLSQELEDQWNILRRRQRQDRVARLLGLSL